jgi:peptidoglycan/xylan/chitin deacetylase (PgdA/CDA1 family)
MKTKTRVCITIDTEGDSATNPRSTYLGIQHVLPKMLEQFDAFGIKATFFVQQDEICQAGSRFPGLWQTCKEKGHEIGFHAHGIIQASLEQKEAIITRGLDILKDQGLDPVSYRGGRFHLTGQILKILEKNGIRYDSSVVPGLREVFKDGTERCNHTGAPAEPYFPSYQDHTKAGDSRILEIPINRYTKLPLDMFVGIMQGSSKDMILFDYFHETRKDDIIIVLIHSWEGLSLKIRSAVRRENSGKTNRIIYNSLGRFFSSDFLTNGAYLNGLYKFLKYISGKEDVCFATIRDAGRSRVEGASR